MVIMHHTDCGIRRLAEYPEQLAAFFEIPAPGLDAKFVDDPYAAVGLDVGIARATLPPTISISGMVYDVQSGLVEVVDPATTE
jgi:carbonic anhydrase